MLLFWTRTYGVRRIDYLPGAWETLRDLSRVENVVSVVNGMATDSPLTVVQSAMHAVSSLMTGTALCATR